MKKLDEVQPSQGNAEPSAKKRKLEDVTAVQSTLTFDPDTELNLDMTSTSDSSDSDEEMEDNLYISGVCNESGKSKKERLNSPHFSLMNCIALCYLGLLYAGEAVLLVDIAR